jgi:hypothetical protein
MDHCRFQSIMATQSSPENRLRSLIVSLVKR